MAIPISGIKGDKGVLLWSAQAGGLGDVTTPASSAGICSFDFNDRTEIRDIFTLGRRAALFTKPGWCQVDFTVNIEWLQNTLLLLKGINVDGQGNLPYLTFGYGYELTHSSDNWAKEVQDCLIHRVELSIDQDTGIRATLTGVGGLITPVTNNAWIGPAHLTEEPWGAYELWHTRNPAPASDYPIRSFSMTVENNVDVRRSIKNADPTLTPTTARIISGQATGAQKVTGELVSYVPSQYDIQGACMDSMTVTMNAKQLCVPSGSTANELTITLSQVRFEGERMTASPEGDILWTTPFVSAGVSFS